MKNEEKEKNIIEGEIESNEIVSVTDKNYLINDVSNLNNTHGSKKYMYTTLKDKKTIFNLDSEVDYKINDFVGKEIEIADVLVKVFEREEKNFDDETGEILNTYKYSKVTIIIDKEGKSYVTGSKMFTNQMIDLINGFGEDVKGTKIKIINRKIKDSDNKALGFVIV